MIESCSRESLVRGYFPYGADSSIDTLHSPLLNSYKAAADYSTLFNNTSYYYHSTSDLSIGIAKEGSAFYLTDTKASLQQYLYFFPMLPRPPLPKPAQCVASIGNTNGLDELDYEEAVLKQRRGFIHVPTSQRDLLAHERAEEERREREMVREAERLQLERQQKQIQKGRLDMKKYQSVSKHEDEDSDNDDDHTSRKTGKEGGDDDDDVVTEEIIAERLVTVVSGVHTKSSTIVKEFNLSNIPVRVGGVMKWKKTIKIIAHSSPTLPRSNSVHFDVNNSSNSKSSSSSSSSSAGRPSLRPSIGLYEFMKRSPVSLSYSSSSISTMQTATLSSVAAVSASVLSQLTNKLQDTLLDIALSNFNISQDHSFYYEDHRYYSHRDVVADIHTYYSSSDTPLDSSSGSSSSTVGHHHVMNKDISLSRLIRVKPNHLAPYIFGVSSYRRKEQKKSKKKSIQVEDRKKS